MIARVVIHDLRDRTLHRPMPPELKAYVANTVDVWPRDRVLLTDMVEIELAGTGEWIARTEDLEMREPHPFLKRKKR